MTLSKCVGAVISVRVCLSVWKGTQVAESTLQEGLEVKKTTTS